MDNLIKAFTVTEKGTEYLMAECNYGHIGSDDAVFAKRKVGTKKWKHIGIFKDKKQPVAHLWVFDKNSENGFYGYYKKAKPITNEEFIKVLKELKIEGQI